MNKVAVIPTYCNLLFNSAALVQYVAIRCSSNQRALINSRPNEILQVHDTTLQELWPYLLIAI